MFRVKYVNRLFVLSNNYLHLSRYINYNLKYSHVNRVYHNNFYFKNFSPVLNSINNYCVSAGNSRISDALLNLNTNYREQQRIYKRDVEALIEEIENEGFIDEDNSLLLLHCCGNLIPDELPPTRISLAQQVWQTFINKNIEINVQHYNALLQSYIENRMSLSFKDFLAKMNCEPNEQTYDLLLECVCENGDISQAVEVVNIMKEKGLSVNEPVFSSLIIGHLRCGDFKSAQNILETMRIAHIVPSSRTYTALLRGCAEAGDTDQFRTAVNLAANREFTSRQLISILHSVCLSENVQLLPLIKKTWSSMIDSRSFEGKLTRLCTHLIHIGKPLIAYELFKCLVDPEVGFASESDTYGAFLFFEFIRANMPSNIVIRVADDLIKTNRNSFALFKATEVALRIPDVKLSLTLLHALYERNVTLRNHYFWPILIHKGRLHGGKGIFEIFDIMLQYKLNIAQETLEMCSLQYMNEMHPDVIIYRLKKYNLTAKDIITPLSIVLLRAEKVKEVAELGKKGLKYKVKLDGSRLIKPLASTYISSNNVNNVVTILQNILSKNQSEDWAGQLVNLIFTRSGEKINYEQVLNLLKTYKTRNIKISVPCADKIEHFTNKIRVKDFKSKILNALNSLDITSGGDNNHYIPHPRDMNLEELECHLVELRNKKMETRGILRKLIQMHCRFGNVEQASVFCSEFEQAGYTMSPGMKAGILDLYIKSNQCTEAWNAYSELKDTNPSFKVDEFKVIDLARLLVNNNMTDEAVKILKNESTNRQVLGGKAIEHNCWNLLDSVARTGIVQETKTIFKLLVKNGYCTESNIVLGPLIRVHMCNDNLNEAVEEFLNCCIKYNKTPLLHELLCTLVQKEMNEELIKKTIEATALVHGIGNAQMSLAIALAETGYVKSLRKLFMESSALLPMNLLEQYCQRCMTEGKSEPLINLVASAKGIAAIDLSAVYFSLISIYSSNNDTESALTLWNDMQESHIIPSDKTKHLIANLLNKQKHFSTNK